jgi:AraC family transcriptional regulator
MNPEIKILPEQRIIGIKISMSLDDNKTGHLWQNFMSVRKSIADPVSDELLSVEIYPPDYFKNFSHANTFEKWAAVPVKDFSYIPEKMSSLVIPEGLYAVFHYKGRSSQAGPIFKQIFSEWLPSSVYLSDDRPHFEVMGKNYRNEDPESEEDFYIPLKFHQEKQ